MENKTEPRLCVYDALLQSYRRSIRTGKCIPLDFKVQVCWEIILLLSRLVGQVLTGLIVVWNVNFDEKMFSIFALSLFIIAIILKAMRS